MPLPCTVTSRASSSLGFDLSSTLGSRAYVKRGPPGVLALELAKEGA